MMNVFHMLLALGMLITGSINTLTTKAADQSTAANRYGDVTSFNHPFTQAAGMFIGEMLCLGAFYALVLRARLRGEKMETGKPFNPFIFVLPALCDMTATSTMYLGLALTSVSIFQMLRGSVVVFTAIFSVVFLKRKLGWHNWIGVVLVIGGTAIVGAQSQVCPDEAGGPCDGGSSDGGSAMIGNILIIVAQLIVAVQMVVEERFIGGYDIPALQVVGFEGLFGFSILSLVLIILYHVPLPSFLCNSYCDPAPAINGTFVGATAGPFALQAWSTAHAANANSTLFSPLSGANGYAAQWADPSGAAQCVCQYPELCNRFEDALDAFTQMGNNGAITGYILGNIISIAFFNYFGVSVTKHINAATRMVLDSLRTMVIWFFSLGVHWEKFCWVEVIGFIVLLAGTMIYNGIIRIPGLPYDNAPAKPAATGDEAATGLLTAGTAGTDEGSLNGDHAYHGMGQGGEGEGIEVGSAGLAVGVGPSMASLMNTPTMTKATLLHKR